MMDRANQRLSPRWAGPWLGVTVALLLLVACSSAPTPYRSADGRETGYSSQQIEADRFRVTFTGNHATALDTVRNYVLYRAAELTVAEGFDHFTVVDRTTESRASGISPTRVGVGVGGGSGGSGVGIGLSSFLGGPSEQYSVFMDVVMTRGAEPTDDVHDAHEVLRNLGPTLVRPTQ